jgi:uncharacterized RDD family membrane protein YckC
MRKDTPIGTQLPEWKKEVAEKVKAYGERKKRLTTPPHPLKENNPSVRQQQIPVKQTISLAEEPEPFIPPKPPLKPMRNEIKQEQLQPIPPDPVEQPAVEIWPEDIQEFSRLEKLILQETEEEDSSNASTYLVRRFGAGLIDHGLLIAITVVMLFAFSVFLNQSMQWVLLSAWKGSLSLFLLVHFIYYLYFYRTSRQTPGMLFMSLELRHPVLSSIPLSKIIFRWFLFVVLNIFNIVPLLAGKQYLLLDRLSGTEVRSFN